MRPITSICTLIAALQILSGTALASGGWTWPVRGPVITAYRNGDDPYAAGQHRGVDIGAPVGARVVAAAAGNVTFAGVVGSSGLVVSERTADGRFDLSYLHLSSVAVRRGDSLAAGASLGAVGVSGRRSAEQPHLHFGVREAGERSSYRDPLDFLAPPPAGEAPGPAPVPAPAPEHAVRESAPASSTAPAAAHAPAAASLPASLPLPGLAAGAPAAAALPSPSLAVDSPPGHPGSATGHLVDGWSRHGRTAGGAHAASRPRAVPTPEHGPVAPARRSSAAPASVAHGAQRHGGLDLGWLAACIGLVAAATALAHPDATRKVARRGRAGVGALLARQ
jgi:hypothetical protein